MLTKTLNIILLFAIIGYGIYYFYKMPKFKGGEVAPDFTGVLLNGGQFKLSSLEGGYTLLDFWGSWCGPCRSESPELVALHQRFNNKEAETPFNIVSVAIEQDKGRWKKAIEADHLDWEYHICQDGRFKSPIALMYGVKEIPTKYLIGPSREVLLTNPSFEELNNYLSEVVK